MIDRRNFSSTQGANNWYYQEWTGSAYQDMTWDSGNSRWKGAYTYSLLWGDGGHPQTYDSARKWQAPSAGNITITGNAYDTSVSDGVLMTYLARSSDGINWTRQNGGYSVFAKPCTDVKYLSSANKYYMVYGEVDDNKIYWNISSSMTSWPAHSSSRTIAVNTSIPWNHNPGLLGDGQGCMNTSSKAYYGAGSSWGVWDIDMSNITVYP